MRHARGGAVSRPCRADAQEVAPYATARGKLPDVFAFANALGGGTPARPAYATDTAYGAKIAAVIRGSNLTQYDR